MLPFSVGALLNRLQYLRYHLTRLVLVAKTENGKLRTLQLRSTYFKTSFRPHLRLLRTSIFYARPSSSTHVHLLGTSIFYINSPHFPQNSAFLPLIYYLASARTSFSFSNDYYLSFISSHPCLSHIQFRFFSKLRYNYCLVSFQIIPYPAIKLT